MKQFKYSRTQCELTVDGVLIDDLGSTEWIAPMEVVADASLSSLRRAVDYAMDDVTPSPTSNPSEQYALGRLMVSPDPAADFEVDSSAINVVSISVLRNGSTTLDIEVEVNGYDLDEDDYAPLLAPLLKRLGVSLLDVSLIPLATKGLLNLRVAYGPRGATVADAIDVGSSIAVFVTGTTDGDLTPDATLGLLTAGRADLLLGVPESDWLDVKSQGYPLGTDAGKIELAQDVARFANGNKDALLLIGIRAAKNPQTAQEAITKITSAVHPFKVAQYHQVIDARVFPPVLGLTVEGYKVALKGGTQGHLLAIRVPAQPEESKPFLVHGAILGGKVEGAFISIVQRRGEHSIPITAPSIHATLAAGRALLRRGTITPPEKKPSSGS